MLTRGVLCAHLFFCVVGRGGDKQYVRLRKKRKEEVS